MKYKKLLASTAIALAAHSIAANADVIFNVFGPGNAVQNGGSWSVNSSFSTTARFTSYRNYTVTEIDVALVNGAGTNSATVTLMDANSDGGPGSVLGSWKVSGQPSADTGPLTAITHISGIHLKSGQHYFLGIAPGDQTTMDGWVQNSTGWSTTLYNGNTLAYSYIVGPAFDIIGNTASEPHQSVLHP